MNWYNINTIHISNVLLISNFKLRNCFYICCLKINPMYFLQLYIIIWMLSMYSLILMNTLSILECLLMLYILITKCSLIFHNKWIDMKKICTAGCIVRKIDTIFCGEGWNLMYYSYAYNQNEMKWVYIKISKKSYFLLIFKIWSNTIKG